MNQNVIELLPWIGVVFSLLGIGLNAKKYIICWPVWMVGSIIFTFLAFIRGPQIVWADACLWFVFTLSNVYGWKCWAKDRREAKAASKAASKP